MKVSRRIVLAGGSGHIGSILARHFRTLGHEVVVLSRTPKPAPWRVVHWDGETLGSWRWELENCDVLINLAGRSVNCRYNAANRHTIMQSRVKPTLLLGRVLQEVSRFPRLWMNASTATIYRHSIDRPMDEASGEIGGRELNAPSKWRFSIEVATSWEAAFFSCATPDTRKLALRSAMIMSPDRGGVFDMLLGVVRHGLGGKAGSGEQFVSWIHETDFVRSIDYLIAHEEICNVVNVSAPNPLRNREFMRTLRNAWGTRIGMPASKWMLEIGALFLGTETELILKSRCVVPGRLLQSGFEFQFPAWAAAAQDLVDCWRKGRTGS